ncbi:MAG: hypothetical protein KIT31_24095, partial [Deltaproteobacteria bacterium]|nr:hypothetical protein [Deltaproteobacteria bacterium]
MVARLQSSTLVGIDAALLDVECHITRGLPGYHVVGMAATSVKEGAARIKSALNSIHEDLPLKHVTVNLAPADLRKPGCALDLPIAACVVIDELGFSPQPLEGLLLLGELALDGAVRPVKGVLAAAMLAREKGLRGVVVPVDSVTEARVVGGIEVYGVAHLRQVYATLARGEPL